MVLSRERWRQGRTGRRVIASIGDGSDTGTFLVAKSEWPHVVPQGKLVFSKVANRGEPALEGLTEVGACFEYVCAVEELDDQIYLLLGFDSS